MNRFNCCGNNNLTSIPRFNIKIDSDKSNKPVFERNNQISDNHNKNIRKDSYKVGGVP